MNTQSPEAPEQIRGETLEPVSPKPMHYPSPCNIPILGASMDPTFNDTVMQSMQQQSEPLPSIAQHAIPAAALPTTDSAINDNALHEDQHMVDDVAGISDASHHESAQFSTLNPAKDAQEAAPLPESDSFPPEPQPKPSEHDQDTTVVDIPTIVEDASIDATNDTVAELQPATPQDVFIEVSSLPPKPIDTPNTANGNLDYSSILANLSNVIAGTTPNGSFHPTPTQAQVSNTASSSISEPGLSNLPNLPPKPPAQEKPNMHPNYVPGDSLRNYHPHQRSDSSAARQPAVLSHINTHSLPAPPHAYQPPHSANSTASHGGHAYEEDEDMPFDPQTQQLYDQFIQFERENVHDGQWDKFPNGSRLFVGNLSTEKVQKKDVFRKFHRYGRLAQISLKQAYGFVQFMDSAACATALAMEQASKIRGREIHLEVSKPAKSTNKQPFDRNRRRSRSPDYNRGGTSARPAVDRYPGSPRDMDNRRSRDDFYRRTPSPRRGFGGRDDRYDARRRPRSPSPPYVARNRTSLPPRDELDLPFRAPDQIPDVQILVVDQIDQDYIRWVDNAMKSRGTRVDVLMLTPRWPEELVVRRQIVEGVLGVVHLTRADRIKNKVPLRLFNRSQGANNVSFDQYVDLDPAVAADLVLRAKRAQAPPPPPPPIHTQYPPPPQQRGPPPAQYGGYSPRGVPPRQPIPPPAANPTEIQRMLSSLSQPRPSAIPPPNTNPDFARIMGGMGGQPPAGTTGITPDVARLLGQMGQPPSQQYSNSPPPMQQQLVMPPTSQASPDIAQLLANLTKYKPPT